MSHQDKTFHHTNEAFSYATLNVFLIIVSLSFYAVMGLESKLGNLIFSILIYFGVGATLVACFNHYFKSKNEPHSFKKSFAIISNTIVATIYIGFIIGKEIYAR